MARKRVIDQTKDYLRKYGWNVFQEVEEPNEKQGMLVVPWKGLSGDSHMLLIDPIEEKNVLIFRVPMIVKAPAEETPAARLNGLLLALAALNYNTIMGAWAYDPRDGEVVFKFAIPTHGNAYEYEDFEHCMTVVQLTLEVEIPKLKAILDGTKTGRDIAEAEGLAMQGKPQPEPVGPSVI
jgi:hypothetical protein